jgi:hypothetical protein
MPSYNSLILSSTNILYEKIKNDELDIIRRNQKTKDDYNYYFNPSLYFKLYNARVKYVTNTYIILEFDYAKNINLLSFLGTCSSLLQEFVVKKFPDDYSSFYKMHVEDLKKYKFSVRASFKKIGSKFATVFREEHTEVPFRLPKINSQIDYCEINIKNLWKNSGRLGYNLELVELNLT